VTITLYFKGKRRRDIDNYLKPLIDALKDQLFEDDSMIEELIVTKKNKWARDTVVILCETMDLYYPKE
jgi:Holliday junction resolvase RusA-like endonuclease